MTIACHLADALPAAGGRWTGRIKPLSLQGELALKNFFRRGGGELTGNILRGAEVTHRNICAEYDVPDFCPARFFIEVVFL